MCRLIPNSSPRTGSGSLRAIRAGKMNFFMAKLSLLDVASGDAPPLRFATA